MPGYKTHRQVAAVTAPFVCWGAWALQNGAGRVLEEMGKRPADYRLDNVWLIAGRSLLVTLGAIFGQTMGSPDLDIPSAPYNSWKGLRFLWLPWQITVKHRSPLSHWPMLGTVAKMMYINVVLIGVVLFITGLWDISVWVFFELMGWPSIGFSLFLIVAGFIWKMLQSPLYWLFLMGDIAGMMIHDATDWLDGLRKRHFQGEKPPLEDEEDND